MGSLAESHAPDVHFIDLTGEGGGGAGYVSVKKFLREAVYLFRPLLLADEEAEVFIVFLQSFQFVVGGGDPELLLQLIAAVLEGLLVQEYEVRGVQLLSCFSGDLDVEFLGEVCVEESDAVAVDE